MTKKNKVVLKIFCLNQPFIDTEWRSILGDKYSHALPFDYTITKSIEESTVIAWDGIVSLKLRRILPEIAAHLKSGKVLLMMGESQTLLRDHLLVELFNSPEVSTIQLSGWSVLPEEILAALQTCYQKIANV